MQVNWRFLSFVQDVLANKEYVVYLIDAGCDMMLPFENGVRSFAHSVEMRNSCYWNLWEATIIREINLLFGSCPFNIIFLFVLLRMLSRVLNGYLCSSGLVLEIGDEGCRGKFENKNRCTRWQSGNMFLQYGKYLPLCSQPSTLPTLGMLPGMYTRLEWSM